MWRQYDPPLWKLLNVKKDAVCLFETLIPIYKTSCNHIPKHHHRYLHYWVKILYPCNFEVWTLQLQIVRLPTFCFASLMTLFSGQHEMSRSRRTRLEGVTEVLRGLGDSGVRVGHKKPIIIEEAIRSAVAMSETTRDLQTFLYVSVDAWVCLLNHFQKWSMQL